jgi:hypothetical protein
MIANARDQNAFLLFSEKAAKVSNQPSSIATEAVWPMRNGTGGVPVT